MMHQRTNSYQGRPQSTFIPPASYALPGQMYEQQQQPMQHPPPHQQQVLPPQQQQQQQLPPPQALPPPQPKSTVNLVPQTQPQQAPIQTGNLGAPLSGSRPPLSPSALLAQQQARIQAIQAQSKAAAAARNNASSSSFAAAKSVFSSNAAEPQPPPTPSRRPLPQPAGGNNASGSVARPPSVGATRSTSSRPLSMPPQPLANSLSTGSSPLPTPQSQRPPSPTKGRPLPGTPGGASSSSHSVQDGNTHNKRMTVDLGRISGLPSTGSGFSSGGMSRSSSPFKQQQQQSTGGGAPQLPPLSLSSTGGGESDSFSRTTGMAALNDTDRTPKRRTQSPPRFSSNSNSPTKEGYDGSHMRETSSSSQRYGQQQGDATSPSSIQTAASSSAVSVKSSGTAASSGTATGSSSPTKKFTPIWKRTIPDYPAPVFGYAAGMVSDPWAKSPATTPGGSATTPSGSNPGMFRCLLLLSSSLFVAHMLTCPHF